MGFFGTRSDAKQPKRSKYQPPTKETLHKLGLKGVHTMNPRAQHPLMEPDGPEDASVYVLGFHPLEKDDVKGRPFSSPEGFWFRRKCPRHAQGVTRYNNIVRTMPKPGSEPEYTQIECFRPSVVEDIEKTKPEVILALGPEAAKWVLGDGYEVLLIRGRKFPVKVGNHECWLVPTMGQDYIFRVKEERRVGKVPGKELEKAFERDIDFAYSIPGSEKPVIHTPESCEKLLKEEVDIILPDQPFAARRVCAALRRLKEAGTPYALDIETTGLRARDPGMRILSMALANDNECFTFPWNHNRAGWSSDDAAAIYEAFWDLLNSDVPLIAQNTLFELSWLSKEYNGTSFVWTGDYHDTQAQAYVLDERKRGHSLNFLCVLYFGLRLKAVSSKVDVRNAEGADVVDLLKYNALDSIYTLDLWHLQKALVEEQGLERIYKTQIARLPTLAAAHHLGFPVDQEEVVKQHTQGVIDLQQLTAEIHEFDVIRLAERVVGPFNPVAPDHLKVLMRDVLQSDAGQLKNGKYTTEASALAKISHPVIEPILQYKKVHKLVGTYLQPLMHGTEGSVMYPDGSIHPVWKPTETDSGRLASEDPNGQNTPKRTEEGKAVRRVYSPGPGEVLISVDYGQIEARIFACASKDKSLLDALYNNFDIHLHWANRVAELYPPTFEARGSDIKSFRRDMKTDLVFSSFYGAQLGSVARRLDMPMDVAKVLFHEFWNTYPDIRKWQRKTQAVYDKYFYVESLTGRRRRGPLSENQITNTPIQGAASDVVVTAMLNLGRRAFEEKKPWLQPRLNIHDDLTFVVPEHIWEEALEDIIMEMLSVKFDWLVAPLSVEAEWGYNWCDMESLGEFHSHEIFS